MEIQSNIQEIERSIQIHSILFSSLLLKCASHEHSHEMANDEIDLYGDLDDYDLAEQLKKVSALTLECFVRNTVNHIFKSKEIK